MDIKRKLGDLILGGFRVNTPIGRRLDAGEKSARRTGRFQPIVIELSR